MVDENIINTRQDKINKRIGLLKKKVAELGTELRGVEYGRPSNPNPILEEITKLFPPKAGAKVKKAYNKLFYKKGD
jgi:hypothetical protein